MINWFEHLYPYGNLHELNLDWILNTIKKLVETMDNFINLNTIKYADPILWDITRQYEANTVVVDGRTGNAYISTRAVPSGVQLSRTEYWTQIYNYADELDKLREQIASNEGDSSTATRPYNVGELVFISDELYRIIAPMIAGDSFVVNSNIVKVTIEEIIGNLNTLTTIDKTNIVNAINEVLITIGDLSTLDTEDKSTIVDAINEVLTIISTVVGNLENLTTSDKTNVVNAINEVLTTIGTVVGDLENLTTSDKTNVVNAINSLKEYVDRISNYIYYPENYGAIGDGVTDDTQAIQDMFDAMVQGSTAIFTSPAGYYISDTININVPNIVITGGYGEIEAKRNIKTDQPIVMFNIATHGVCVSSLNFHQPSDDYLTATAINFTGSSQGDTDAVVENCTIGFMSVGIHARGKNVRIVDNQLSHCTDCIKLSPTVVDTENRGFEIIRNRFHSSVRAIYNDINKASNYRFDCTIRDNFASFTDVFYYGYGGVIIQSNTMANGGSKGVVAGRGVYIRDSVGSRITNIIGNTFENRVIDPSMAEGVASADSTGTTNVENNVINGYGRYGINMTAGKIIVKNNYIRSANFGIVIGSPITGGVVENNIGESITTNIISNTSTTVTPDNNVTI